MTRLVKLWLIASIISVPAAAQPDMVSITVKPADFSSPAARAKLDRRIAAAIEDICRTRTPIEFYQSAEVVECRRSARIELDAMIAQIHADAVGNAAPR